MNGIRSYFFLINLLCISLSWQNAFAKVWDAHAILNQEAANLCALTFDDGPTHLTGQLLDYLKEENTPATFVVLGSQAQRYPKLIKRMISEGHEIASHGYAHVNLREVSLEEGYDDIKKTHSILNNLGAKISFFRPPYGKYTKDTIRIASELGMSILLWSVDSRDWERRPDYGNMPNILERPMTAEEMRGVFLFHDTKKNTVNDAKLIIAVLRAVGCKKFVTVSKYLQSKELENQPKKLFTKHHKSEPIVAKIYTVPKTFDFKLDPVTISPKSILNYGNVAEGKLTFPSRYHDKNQLYFKSNFD